MAKKQRNTAKKGAWYIKYHGSYVPASWQGWLTYVPYVGFLVATMWYVYDTSDSLYEIPIRIVPYWVSAVVIMLYLARRKS
jgi:hypothetical protein